MNYSEITIILLNLIPKKMNVKCKKNNFEVINFPGKKREGLNVHKQNSSQIFFYFTGNLMMKTFNLIMCLKLCSMQILNNRNLLLVHCIKSFLE